MHVCVKPRRFVPRRHTSLFPLSKMYSCWNMCVFHCWHHYLCYTNSTSCSASLPWQAAEGGRWRQQYVVTDYNEHLELNEPQQASIRSRHLCWTGRE